MYTVYQPTLAVDILAHTKFAKYGLMSPANNTLYKKYIAE